MPAGSWAARTRGKPHPTAEPSPASWLDTPWALLLLGETLLGKASTAEAEQAEFLALCEAAIGARVFLCVCPYGCPDPVFRPLLPSHLAVHHRCAQGHLGSLERQHRAALEASLLAEAAAALVPKVQAFNAERAAIVCAEQAQEQKAQAKRQARQSGRKRLRLGDRPAEQQNGVTSLNSRTAAAEDHTPPPTLNLKQVEDGDNASAGLCAVEAVLQLVRHHADAPTAAQFLGVEPWTPQSPADIICRLEPNIPRLAISGGVPNAYGHLAIFWPEDPPGWDRLIVQAQQWPPSLAVIAEDTAAIFLLRGVVLSEC